MNIKSVKRERGSRGRGEETWGLFGISSRIPEAADANKEGKGGKERKGKGGKGRKGAEREERGKKGRRRRGKGQEKEGKGAGRGGRRGGGRKKCGGKWRGERAGKELIWRRLEREGAEKGEIFGSFFVELFAQSKNCT